MEAAKQSCSCSYASSDPCDFCKTTSLCKFCQRTRNDKHFVAELGMCTLCNFRKGGKWIEIPCRICKSSVQVIDTVKETECRNCKIQGLGDQNRCSCGMEGQGYSCDDCEKNVQDDYLSRW